MAFADCQSEKVRTDFLEFNAVPAEVVSADSDANHRASAGPGSGHSQCRGPRRRDTLFLPTLVTPRRSPPAPTLQEHRGQPLRELGSRSSACGTTLPAAACSGLHPDPPCPFHETLPPCTLLCPLPLSLFRIPMHSLPHTQHPLAKVPPASGPGVGGTGPAAPGAGGTSQPPMQGLRAQLGPPPWGSHS